jgi:uncharacterized protein
VSQPNVFALSAPEVRVLGCLLEKQRTTPDAYPLSLNALRLACNQSTNRDPIVGYDDAIIRDALHRLERRGLARLASGAGSRAAKYRHLLADALPMQPAEQAVMCVLMLRGPQTPGELKQRTERMHAFADLAAVHDALQALIERGLAERLGRRPGQKEERYSQLMQEQEETPAQGRHGAAAHEQQGAPGSLDVAREAGAPAPDAVPATGLCAPSPVNGAGGLEERVARLEREVARLRAALDEPRAGTGAPVGEPRP